jgi:hypothetical protein
MSDTEEYKDRQVDAEILEEQGQRVYSMFWDTGGPGGGADYNYVYQYQGAYYHIFLYSEVSGPYVSLADAIKQHELGMINGAAKQIETLLAADALLPMLYPALDPSDLPYPFEINGEPWQVNRDETITRAPGSRASD